MELAGDRPPRYGNIETGRSLLPEIETRRSLLPGSYQDQEVSPSQEEIQPPPIT